MPKVKYHFNPQNLTYEKYKPSIWERMLRLLGFFSSSLVLSLIMVFVLFNYFESPKERKFKREIAQYELQLNSLNERIDRLKEVSKELAYRDQNVYRIIFEAKPIPDEVRKAGYGGVERYRDLRGYDNSEILINTTQKVDKLSKEIYVLTKSFDEIAELAKNKTQLMASIPAIQPISNDDLTRFSSGFGYRIHPIYKTVKFHDGVDFTATKGTPVYATGDGTVEEVDYSRSGYGNKIVLNHGFGYKTLYAHLNSFEVKKGQKVKRGEKIGEVGNTGLSTAPHLHYEVIKGNSKIDPINFFHNDLNPDEYEKIIELANRANQSFD